MGGHSHDISKEIRGYWIIFGALIFFTFVTVGIAQFHFPLPIAVGLALAVALFKGGLVAAFFMHLISERYLIYSILLFAVFFFLGLLLLPVTNDHDRIIGTLDTGKTQQAIQLQGKKEEHHDVH